MERAGWKDFDERLAGSKKAGKIRGIGMATYIEACAFPGSEPAFVELNGDGTVTLKIGTQTNGQGHATAYAQFVAEKLNMPIEKIIMRQGDTDDLENGGGTGGSRSIPLGGVSASRAGEDLAEKIRRIAADELEASPLDIELHEGSARIVGTDRSMSFAEIAKAAKKPEDLQGMGEFVQDEATYPNGTHICEVEIDPETGATGIVGYTIVDDFGVTVNPILLAGQMHGGVVQGIGQALTRGHRLWRGRPAADRELHGLCRAARRRFAVLPFRDPQRAVDHQRHGHQGRRRGGHDRSGAGRAQRGDRRALARLRHPPYRDAGDAGRASGRRSRTRDAATVSHRAPSGRLQPARRHRAEGRLGGDLRRHVLPASRLAGHVPAGQIVFFRSFFAIFPIVAVPGVAAANCAPRSHTKHPLSHIARGVVGVASMGLGFFALTRLPLPEAITLNYAQPLLVVVFSAIFLGENDPRLPLERGRGRPGRRGDHLLAEADAVRLGRGDRQPRSRSALSPPSSRRRCRRSRCCWCAGSCTPRKRRPSCCGSR